MKKIIKSVCSVLGFLTVLSGCKGEAADLDVLYESAVRDAAFADEDEILPLVSLTPDEKMTTWDSEGRVLL